LSERKIKPLNARVQTIKKFDLILNQMLPKPSSVDLLDFIIDKFIETQNISLNQKLVLEN